jgi:hypothetical protein
LVIRAGGAGMIRGSGAERAVGEVFL